MEKIFSDLIDSQHLMDKSMYGQLRVSFDASILDDFLLILRYKLEARDEADK